METKNIYFKSDFTVILASEAQWGGCPFRLSFYTASPSRSFVACFDGENYHNCQLLPDGRLEIGINQKDGNVQTLMGIGKLMLAPEFYLDNDAFRDHVCNEFIKPFAPVFVDTDGTEYQVTLDMQGSSTLITIGTLPAFYKKGDKGDSEGIDITDLLDGIPMRGTLEDLGKHYLYISARGMSIPVTVQRSAFMLYIVSDEIPPNVMDTENTYIIRTLTPIYEEDGMLTSGESLIRYIGAPSAIL